ncbi:hypothetical protein [Guptibacillus algicola]|uniref:hypothetical protein n=1 Tax=Guptibacillus algicola TaxID=225844 RepID=UPI001CD236FC|nr:hypothetical protein [Alkalihalobacillus algicola]MCA0987604.1 hypothetical protein [Alkalihalobacillus algicola]
MIRLMLGLLVLLLIITGCADPSPLRSNIEVAYNQMFGTEFGVMDQVIVKQKEETLAVLGAEEFLELVQEAKESKSRAETFDYTITLQTSEAMKEYSKEQTKEVLTYDSKTKVLCSVKVCYDVPSAFHSEVIPN